MPSMLNDVRNQPASLLGVLDYHFGAGRKHLLEIAARLRGSRRIVITGMGASLFAALPFATYLGAQGFNIIVAETSELLHYQTKLCENATVVIVSRSGNTVEAVKLLLLLRDVNATIIGVTDEPESRLAQEADAGLIINSKRDGMVAVQTYTGSAIALLLLAAAVNGEFGEHLQKAAEAAVHTTSDLISRCLHESDSWRTFFEGAPVIHVIGRGPSLASAYESALLFNEAAKLPAVAVSAGAFRHGPVEIVDETFRAILFATHNKTRELDLTLAADLKRMGAKVNTIALNGSWPIPDVPELFLPVVEIIPVQVAAFCVADWRGIGPDDFRYVSQVTTSETGFKSYGQ